MTAKPRAMPSGLIALLDDVATIAKLAASSLDDVAAAAGKAGTKAAGVVIDDTAVTPRYVTGLSPDENTIGKYWCAWMNSSAVSGTACWPTAHGARSMARAVHLPWSRLLSGIRSL